MPARDVDRSRVSKIKTTCYAHSEEFNRGLWEYPTYAPWLEYALFFFGKIVTIAPQCTIPGQDLSRRIPDFSLIVINLMKAEAAEHNANPKPLEDREINGNFSTWPDYRVHPCSGVVGFVEIKRPPPSGLTTKTEYTEFLMAQLIQAQANLEEDTKVLFRGTNKSNRCILIAGAGEWFSFKIALKLELELDSDSNPSSDPIPNSADDAEWLPDKKEKNKENPKKVDCNHRPRSRSSSPPRSKRHESLLDEWMQQAYDMDSGPGELIGWSKCIRFGSEISDQWIDFLRREMVDIKQALLDEDNVNDDDNNNNLDGDDDNENPDDDDNQNPDDGDHGKNPDDENKYSDDESDNIDIENPEDPDEDENTNEDSDDDDENDADSDNNANRFEQFGSDEPHGVNESFASDEPNGVNESFESEVSDELNLKPGDQAPGGPKVDQ